jgi:glycosyltransferase involved in cell wall biosynthesis
MKIGIMLRSLDEKGGIGVYTQNITEELLQFDRTNQYILYYRNPANLGRFARFDNVTERVIKGTSKAMWDQVKIPLACWKDKVDVIFHPKFTVPLLAPCKAVMVLHGAGWYMPEMVRFFRPADVRYIHMVMPLYFRKCAVALSVNQLGAETFSRELNLPAGKIKTVYFAPARRFKRVTDKDKLQQVKDRYSLPDKFILTLTKRGGDTRKNLGQILKAYERYYSHAENPHKLVVGGKDCHLFREEYAIPDDDYGADILFPGWIDQEDLPSVYSLTDLYLYPSNLEAFPVPITEAMACGTPIITSDVNGPREIAGDAALFVDPGNPDQIADAIFRVLGDEKLQQALSEKGLARSANYSWDKCARETLESLVDSVNTP